MRALLTALVILVAVPVARAQDKAKSDFTIGGEFRLRDVFNQNEAGVSDSQGLPNTYPTHHNEIGQRFKLGLGFRANEKFMVSATLLQGAYWGQTAGEIGDRGATTGGDEANFMSVNEAYATWMMSDNFSMKFGRMNFAFGDGSVMATNDYQMQPDSFDGATGNYEIEFGRFQMFAFKYRDEFNTGARSANSDPQHDAYGLVFDLKTHPEWIKIVDINVIQDSADGIYGQSGSTIQDQENINELRYGATLGFAFSVLDLKLGYESVTGKTSTLAGGTPGGTLTSTDVSANMMQGQLGLNLVNFLGSRIHVGYHRDSGQSSTDNQNKTYDAYFYDKHTGSGLMELVAWGNLTDLSAGWDIKPSDRTSAGFQAHLLSKTQATGSVTAGTYGQFLFTNATASSAGIGNEYDLWMEHNYDGGLSMLMRAGYFTPGAALKNETAPALKASISQIMVQGQLTF